MGAYGLTFSVLVHGPEADCCEQAMGSIKRGELIGYLVKV